MPDQPERWELGDLLDKLGSDASAYFDKAEEALANIPRDEGRFLVERFERDYFWTKLPQDLRHDAERLADRLLSLAGHIALAVQNAPLASEADQRDIMNGTKAMRAALLLREFRSWSTEVIHDEGTVLGVHPPGQSDNTGCAPEIARRNFSD